MECNIRLKSRMMILSCKLVRIKCQFSTMYSLFDDVYIAIVQPWTSNWDRIDMNILSEIILVNVYNCQMILPEEESL